MSVNIYELFIKGQQKLQAAATELETTKQGVLRAGNTGLMNAEGIITGPCMALTYLRYKGINIKGLEDDGDSGGAGGRELMFEGGRSNEDSWKKVLEQSWDGLILAEEEIPTAWQTANKINVTGRPDLVLCRSIEVNKQVVVKPVIGVELKQVSSFWTAYEVKFKGQPKYPHLLQAAHYSWQLGVPFELWYTSRTDFHMDSWIKKHLPKPGEQNSEFMAYTYYRLNDDNSKSKITKNEFEQLPESARISDPLKTMPFIQGYKIELRAGILFYKDVMLKDSAWIKTNILIDDIIRYYETVSELKKVPKEPLVLKADGTKAGYKASTYCLLGDLCCKHTAGQDINKWVVKVNKALPTESK